MKVVDNLLEDVGGSLVAIFIDHEDAQAPFTHGEALHWRRLVAKSDSQKLNKCGACRGAVMRYIHDMLFSHDLDFALRAFVSSEFRRGGLRLGRCGFLLRSPGHCKEV
jgi:hypothetical protein